MRIVLVNPIWTVQNIIPTNLAELAGYIREYGYPNVSIVDLNYELKKEINIDIIKKAIEIIQARKPHIIGVTCNTIHVPFCAELCKEYKKKYKTPIVLGGIHPTFRPNKMFRLSRADYIVRGEGEETFLELLNALNNKCRLSDIAGLSFKNKSGKVIHNPDRLLIKDLSILPFPAYDLLLPYTTKNNLEIFVSASRGCTFGCIFCSANKMWHYQRRKAVERIIDEIKYIKIKYRCSNINFADDCLPLNKRWFDKLLRGLKKLNIRWSCYSRIDTINFQLIKKMKKTGCVNIYHGLESGNPRIRELLGKKLPSHITNDTIIALVKKEIRVGISSVCSFMVGIPTETKKEMQETIEMLSQLKQLGATTQLWIMTPYPDTKAVQIYKNKLIKFNRWKAIRQSDVNKYDQFYLYHKFYDKYHSENPDFYMFRPDIKLKDFLNLYKEGRKKTEMDTFDEIGIFNYIKEKRYKKYFISIDKKFGLEDIDTNIRHSNILISIQRPFLNLDKIINKLAKLETKNCLLSIKIKNKGLSQKEKNNVLRFITALKNKSIKFSLTRPIPSNFLSNISPEFKKGLNIPRDCEDCWELFKINRRGKIELCTGKELYKEEFANDRSYVYKHFLELARYKNKKNPKLCFAFPDNKTIERLHKRKIRAAFYINIAKKCFLGRFFNKCIGSVKKAIKLGYRKGMAHLLLGFCYERMKQHKKAIDELKKAEKIIPKNPYINFSLFKCYKNIGQIKRSYKQLDKGYCKLK